MTRRVEQLARRRDLHRQAARRVLIGKLRALGHEPVALLAPRGFSGPPRPSFLELTDATAPAGHRSSLRARQVAIEPLLRAYEPDLMTCWGFPWKIPQAALEVPRLGSINMHPALLPRHRGPIPLAWALRDGDPVWGQTWHRMDAELDTGNLLVQGTVPIEDDDVDIAIFGDKLRAGAIDLLAAGARAGRGRRSGRSAADGGRDLGRPFRGRRLRSDRLVAIRRGRSTTRCAPGSSRSACPVCARRSPSSTAKQVVVLQTRLTDPGGGATTRRVWRRARSGSSRPSPSDVARRGLGFGAVLADRRAIGCRL